MIDSIPSEIRQEIRHYRQEREEGRTLQIYTPAPYEQVILERIVKDGYRRIVIEKQDHGDITLIGTAGTECNISVEIAENFYGNLILKDAELVSENGRPCIDIGDGSIVRLVLIGRNELKCGGIRVPESAKLEIGGDGKLSITIDGSGCYAIGNDGQSRHGDMLFEQGVSVTNRSSVGICIGSGLGGRITIVLGQFNLNMACYYGVGIGSLYVDTDLDLFACDISIEMSVCTGTAIGSLDGSCLAYLHSASAKLYLSGSELVGIGTVNGSRCDARISEASAEFKIFANHCLVIAAPKGSTVFQLSRAGMQIYAEGVRARVFGDRQDDTDVQLINSDISVSLLCTEDSPDDPQFENIKMTGGRANITINERKITL